jgi:hypothetical protein
MTIVEGIGEKYLWVDSLCIVHDDEDLLQDAIRRMGDYYQNSILTIAVVSTLAACEQIPGIAPESRKILPYVEVCGMQIFAFPVPLHLELKGSKYESRAWTYQERLLSTRTLYITNNMAYYKCLQHGRSELDGFTVLAGHLNPLQISTSIPEIQHDGLDTPQKPSQWEIYLELVRQYSQKELSYPSDELAAFEGIMRRLSSTWNTKFLAGLPISALLTTLHWVPSCKLDVAHETSERRAGFPSWSWASRAGPVEWLDAVVLPEWWEWEEKGILSPVMSNPVATFNFTAQIHLRSQVSSIKGLSAELTTTIVYAAQFLSPGRGNLMPLIKIFDTQGRWCGRICHSSPGVISNQNTDELGIIMLSTCAARKILTFENAETMEYRGWEYFFDHGVFPTTGEDGKPARLCNLLLVEYKEDGMAERRALCQIHSDIWEIMERKEQDVILI